jgi:hypothetical protein
MRCHLQTFDRKLLAHLVKLTFQSRMMCRNPSLELMTKARACKGAGQEGSPRVTSHAPGSVGECEKMNPHTPK